MKLRILAITFLIGLCLVEPVYADVMDPKIPEETSIVTTTDQNAMLPSTPDVTVTSEENIIDDATEQKLQQRQRDRALHTGVVIMDSIMYILGLIAIVIPMIITAFYLCARVNPAVFTRIFVLITLGKINHEEITVPQMLLRTIPVMVVGFFLATGQFREYLSRFWYIVMEKIGMG